MPFVNGSAASTYDPPQPERQIPNARLERIWARQLRIYERMGRADEFAKNIQDRIDRARENEKDVSAVQAALDAFGFALDEAQPIYQSMISIVHSHPGFDEDGKVTDPNRRARRSMPCAENSRRSGCDRWDTPSVAGSAQSLP